MRPYAGRTPATSPAPADPCLVLMQNKTSAVLHALGRMLTPSGAAFLDEAVYDLEAGGLCAFVAAASNELLIVLPSGAHRLTLKGNELRLSPGGGMKQRLSPAPPGSAHRWVLVVDIESAVPSFDHVLPALADLLSQQTQVPELLALFRPQAGFPEVCTVLLPRTAPPRAMPWTRFVIPEALFFVERKATEAATLDGGKVRVSPLGRLQLLFTVEAPEDEPLQVPLHLRAEGAPLRCAERWQLVYICD